MAVNDDNHHKVWAGNWYRGGANWLENRLNNTLNPGEIHDDLVMMRDAMVKLNQAADEIDRLYQIERERDALKAHILSLTDVLDEKPIPEAYEAIQEWHTRKPEVVKDQKAEDYL